MINVKLQYNGFCYHYFFSLRNKSEAFFFFPIYKVLFQALWGKGVLYGPSFLLEFA